MEGRCKKCGKEERVKNGYVLTENFGYSPAEVIKHNFFISIGDVISGILLTYLSYKIYPLKILRTTFGSVPSIV